MKITAAPATHVEQYTISIIAYIILQTELYQITSCKNELDASIHFAKLGGSMSSKQTYATYEIAKLTILPRS
jgi:hypothetical protein